MIVKVKFSHLYLSNLMNTKRINDVSPLRSNSSIINNNNNSNVSNNNDIIRQRIQNINNMYNINANVVNYSNKATDGMAVLKQQNNDIYLPPTLLSRNSYNNNFNHGNNNYDSSNSSNSSSNNYLSYNNINNNNNNNNNNNLSGNDNITYNYNNNNSGNNGNSSTSYNSNSHNIISSHGATIKYVNTGKQPSLPSYTEVHTTSPTAGTD